MSFLRHATLITLAILHSGLSDSSIDRYINTESWPFLYKSGSKQVANLLWYEEGLYVDLPYGYVDNVTTALFSSTPWPPQSKVRDRDYHVQKVTFPPRLYYPVDEEDTQIAPWQLARLGNAVLSQVNEQMLQDTKPSKSKARKRKKKPAQKKATGSGGAFGALKSLAFSLLDQWLFSAKKEGLKAAATGPGPGTGVAEENRSNNETLEVHPMRYLFLLGLLPTTFGSLYSLGYNSLQIMVIGAYIVTSYFIFAEKYPNKSQKDIYEAIEEVISTVISEQRLNEGAEDINEDKSPSFHRNVDFKLKKLIDKKSARFIDKFDQKVFKIFQNVDNKTDL